MTTLNIAFQTLLSSVSDMNLNEGDFLTMNNILKKAFDSNVSPSNITPINITITFDETVTKEEVIRLKFHGFDKSQDKRILYYSVIEDPDCPVERSCPTKQLQSVLSLWIRLKRPMYVSIKTDMIESSYTFRGIMDTYLVEDDALGDDEYCHEYDPLMTQRFCREFLYNSIIELLPNAYD